MKKIGIFLMVIFLAGAVFAHMGDTVTDPTAGNETVWEEMQEHHEAMHGEYGDNFYCDAQGCFSGNMGGYGMMDGFGMMGGSGFGLFGGIIGLLISALFILALLAVLIYFSIKISKEIGKK